jgi:phosphohistidine phosphatase
MKTLLLMRHAKSSWDNPAWRDFDRPLNGRGLKTAPLMGVYLRGQGLKPDLILSSPAQRAQHTAQLVKDAAPFSAPLRYDAGIYEASLKDLLHIVYGLDEQTSTVLLVGHNPGFESLLAYLGGVRESMPTASVANIELNAETWPQARSGGGRLVWLVKPRQLEAE